MTDELPERRSANADIHTAVQIQGLRGDLNVQATKIEAIHAEIAATRNELIEHTKDEKPRIARIERLVWIAVGAVVVIAGIIGFGMSVLQSVVERALFK